MTATPGVGDDMREKAIAIFTDAWEAKRTEIGRGIAPKGTKVGAGIDALIAEGFIVGGISALKEEK